MLCMYLIEINHICFNEELDHLEINITTKIKLKLCKISMASEKGPQTLCFMN